MSRVSIPRRHHVIISCDVGGSVLIVIGCRIVLSPCSLFSSVAAIVRRTAVVSHPSSVSFSYELGKTAQDWISRSSLSGVPTLLVPRLALPSRRVVSCRIVVVVFARGDGRVLRFCSLASRRGSGASFVHPAAWRCACPHPSPVVLFASRPSVSCGVSFACSTMPCGFGQRGVLARPIVSVLLVGGGRCRSWCRGVLPCFPVSSDLLFSCRRSWRSFSSRRGVSSLVSWSGEALASRLILGGSGWAAVLVLPSRARCLLTFMPSGMGRCRSRHRRSNPLLIVLWLWGMCSVWYLPFSSSSPASCSPLAIALASCRQFDLTNETGDGTRGCLLGYCGVAHHASSMNVYNEYDVCDIYKRYKNTRIREYDGYMG